MKPKLTNKHIRLLTSEQKAQVLKQEAMMQHEDYDTSLSLSATHHLPRYHIGKGVWDCSKTSALWQARFIHQNPQFYFNGRVLDMGCGTGIMGIVMGLRGANEVIFSDCSPAAVKNAKINVQRIFDINKLFDATIYKGNLFENVTGHFDCITFNQPYFVGDVPQGHTIAGSMIAPAGLVGKFLNQARKHLKPNGRIIMPFWDFASAEHDPLIGRQHGYDVRIASRCNYTQGLQNGSMRMHELRPR
jgi:methylase of polypeptide subunit release factors